MVLFHHDGTQHGRDHSQDQSQRNQVALDAGQIGLYQWCYETEHQEDQDQRNRRVGAYDASQGLQQLMPGALLTDGGRTSREFHQPLFPTFRNPTIS